VITMNGHDHGYGRAVQAELRGPAGKLRRAIPEVYAGFGALHDSALAPGVLDVRTKELIAFAIAVDECCDGCIAAHAHAAVRHGATPAEAAETIGVVMMMRGGPTTIYGPRAFAAFNEFYGEAQATPA